MKKIFSISIIAVLLVLLTNIDASAQRRKSTTPKEEKEETTTTKQEDSQTAPTATTSKKKKTGIDNYFDESGGFKHRLQYGIHVDPSILTFWNGQFNLRMVPSVGYKITNWAMAGLTGEYNYYRYKDNSQVYTEKIFNYGAYARIKAFKSFYLHTDYRFVRGNFNQKIIVTGGTNTFKDKFKPETNIGIAYRSGSNGWGYEIMGTYNVTHVDGNKNLESNGTYSYRDSPFDLKLGFTYNF